MQLPTYRGQITRPPPRPGRQASPITHSDSGRASPVRNGRNQAQTNAEPAEAQTVRRTGTSLASATVPLLRLPLQNISRETLLFPIPASTRRSRKPLGARRRDITGRPRARHGRGEAVEWPTLSRSDSEQWRPRRGRRRRGTSESCGGSSSCHPTADASTATDSYVLFFFPALFHPCGPRRAASSPLLVCRRRSVFAHFPASVLVRLWLWSRGRSTCAPASGPSSVSPAAASSECRLALSRAYYRIPYTSVVISILCCHSITSVGMGMWFAMRVYSNSLAGFSSVSKLVETAFFCHPNGNRRCCVQNFRIRVVLISSSTIILTHTDLCTCIREFTHRVKSVSMSTFSTQEVEALQKGGNQVKTCIHWVCSLRLEDALLVHLVTLQLIDTACQGIVPEGFRYPENEATW